MVGLTAGALALLAVPALSHGDAAIDRRALVSRHTIRWNDARGVTPLGNGEFCFNADGTGLQTFAGSTLSHWAWHSEPLPAGCTPVDVPPTGTVEQGRILGNMKRASGNGALDGWMFRNPHPLNLARIRFVRPNGDAIRPDEVSGIERSHDLWTGLHTARFVLDGEAVTVETCVHPKLSAVAIRARSVLLGSDRLRIAVEFPYPTADASRDWIGDWSRPAAHSTRREAALGGLRADLIREADGARYVASVAWSRGCMPRPAGDPHALPMATGPNGVLELVCAFAPERTARIPSFAATASATARHWERFWRQGGAVDLSGSKDPRWMELERRIVLSQYEMAVNSAGSWPSSECGLTNLDPWHGQFHMEMVWWHLAHYGLWDRLHLSDEALGCYRTFLPTARKLAAQFGYRGAKWGKQVGPEGRTAPWEGSFVLHWQQPHPLFFAELEYRLRPTRKTLEKWRDIVQETAEYMADFPTRDAQGVYHLRPVMAACEEPTTYDPVFELAYWRWGLDAAQRWRRRLGLPTEPRWDEVRRGLAPLPKRDGLYVLSPERTEVHGGSHPDALGVYGMLPPLEGVDAAAARATVEHMAATWDCMGWGWDFPWMAMAAARCGRPDLAVEALLSPHPNNRYDERGINTGGPCPYLPGNGGLLYAVAMMAAGWDGAPAVHAPGFPADGRWKVRWEGLKPAL
jgi:hypothetical protein